MRRGSELEEQAYGCLRALGVYGLERQYPFDPSNKRRKADFAWPRYKIMVEVDGGTYSRGKRRCAFCGQTPTGGHNTGVGYERDRVRDAEAVILGWTVLRFTGAMVKDGRISSIMARIFKSRNIPMSKLAEAMVRKVL